MTAQPEKLGRILQDSLEEREHACQRMVPHTRDADRKVICGKSFTQRKIYQDKERFIEGMWEPRMCPECIRDVEVAEQRAREQHDEEVGRQARLAELNVPLLYRDVELRNFRPHGEAEDRRRQSRVLQLALRYVAAWPERQNLERLGEFSTIVIFRGETGSGKGHIAWSIAKHVAVEERGRVIFRTLADCVLDLREPWRKGFEGAGERERLRRYREADLLVVDEVSRHAIRGEPAPELYALIAERETWLRPTILTTNETTEGLTQLLGPAIESRAAGSGGIWDFGNADFRLERRMAKEAA